MQSESLCGLPPEKRCTKGRGGLSAATRALGVELLRMVSLHETALANDDVFADVDTLRKRRVKWHGVGRDISIDHPRAKGAFLLESPTGTKLRCADDTPGPYSHIVPDGHREKRDVALAGERHLKAPQDLNTAERRQNIS